MLVYFIPLLSEKSDVGFPISIFSSQSAWKNVMSTCKSQFLFLAVSQQRHQDLSQHVKASFSQSEEVFSRSRITTTIVELLLVSVDFFLFAENTSGIIKF